MTSQSLTWLLSIEASLIPPAPLEIPARENYTTAEISAAVDRLIQGVIRRPYGILGERKTGDAFDDTVDAAAGVFILTPASPFYVLLLGARRLDDVCSSVVTEALNLLDCVVNTGRRVRPLTSITSLGNARTALQALETATSNRSSTFEDISQTPAFQRFDKHTDLFLADAGGAIKVGTEIAQTPQQARSQLAGFVSSITTAMTEVRRRAQLLAVGIDNYNSLNLPALLTQGVITRAREVLQERIDQLEGLSPTARLEFLRETALDVLAGKAVVRGFGSLSRSGEFVPIEGLAAPFTDEDHPGTPASIGSDLLDPFVILEGEDELDVVVDGGPDAVTLSLPRSFIASLDGTAAETFEIDATNDKLTITVTGFSNLNVTLIHGVARTVEEVADEINLAVTTQPITAEPIFNPEKFRGTVSTQNLAGPNLEFVGTNSWQPTYGVQVGDLFQVLDGPMADSLFSVVSLAINVASCTLVSGVGAVVASATVVVGPPARFLRIRISDAGAASAVAASRALGIPTVTAQANLTLGFFPGSSLRCRRTRGDEIAAGINASLSASIDGVARVSAAAVYQGSDPSAGRSDPADPTKVISSVFRALGDLTIVSAVNATLAIAGAASAGVVAGDILTLRTAFNGAQVGRFGTILTASDTAVTATMNASTTSAPGLDIEFGRNLNQSLDRIIRIDAPSPLAGDYRTLDPLSNPMEARLDRSLPISFSFGGQGFTFEMSTGSLQVIFESRSTSLDSELLITGSAAPKFFTPPVVAVGSTRFVLFEKDPKVLGAGDLLEFYSAQYNTPELSIPIIGFERGQRLIELEEGLPISILSLDFSTEIETSFARIRKVARNNYDAFKAQLGLWLALDVNQTQYFRDLNRFLNPLIVNENPTISAVHTAQTHIESLVQALQQLQTILASYQVDTVPQVDTLIDSFLSRGSDRAVDTLLEGRFTDFFGYNSEEVSYLGNTLERMRDVSRLDLPVRRKARKEVIDQELSLGEFEEPDFEFDQSDTQDVDEPDIPGSFIEIAGGNF